MGPVQAIRLTVTGRVQGVGFRPSVYRLATAAGLAGGVRNTTEGVVIEVEGPAAAVEQFRTTLRDRMPPLVRIADIATQALPPEGRQGFVIWASERAPGGRGALIPYDVAVCAACAAEVADPADRRHGYPFTNCTLCGPRYTIIESVPYDRPHTSMRPFTMCAACQAEYDDPSDRRYHAQPNACPSCGPSLTLADDAGRTLADRPLEAARRLLAEGRIVAVRGVGGFHLAVDATNEGAVSRLRRRKGRGQKPFAVLVPDLAATERHACLSPAERALITSDRRPIVLLDRRPGSPLAASVAPDNPRLGMLLPYAPLHQLLLEGFAALVLTSGNLSEEPIAKDNAEALDRLRDIADGFLLHDRDILMSCDDSVAYCRGDDPALVRRSRGYVPDPVPFAFGAPEILAVGGHLKNTFCLTRGDEAFLSQHVGDLENLETSEHFERCLAHLRGLLGTSPRVVACDRHPDYLSTRFARELEDVTVVPVQHHHAHLAACMADRGLDGEVIGLCLDGTGLGDDGSIWGGEVLVGGYDRYRRAARLRPFRLPGGEAAVRQPWRSALGVLLESMGPDAAAERVSVLCGVDRARVIAVAGAVERGINAPLTSSLGRLFDAVSALLGLRATADFDGQAAMAVEFVAAGPAVPWPMPLLDGDPLDLDPRPLAAGILAGRAGGIPVAELAAAFHATVVEGLVAACLHVRERGGPSRVVCSGGCFMNRRLDLALDRALSDRGFEVFAHRSVPANDGGLSLGQAAVAARQFRGIR
jgi:hydrogenase maturation protein HypF